MPCLVAWGAVLWACLALRAAGQAAALLPVNGSADCPCASLADLPPQSGTGYPDDYGIGCLNHDGGSAACASDTPPPGCNMSWCFVRASKCILPVSTEKQDIFPKRVLSYSTCGYLSAATSSRLWTALRGATIRVVLMHHSSGWQGTYYVDGQTIGPTETFWAKVLASAGVKQNVITQFSSGSLPFVGNGVPYPLQVMRQFRQDYPTSQSSFTSCVYMTGMGYADICIGGFTITPARRQVSTMIKSSSMQTFLVVRSSLPSSPTTFWDSILAAFRVFDAQLWVAIGCVIVCMSLLMVWHEHFSFHHVRIGMMAHLPWKDKVELSIYQGFISLLSGGGNTFAPTTRASRMISLGLSAFILLACAAYTANLASYLVVQQVQPTSSLSGIQEAVQQGYRICSFELYVPILVNSFGVPASLLRTEVNGEKLVSRLFDDADCDASLLEEDTWSWAMSQGGRNCELATVGSGALFSVDMGVPVSERVFRTLDLHVTNVSAVGAWKSIAEAARPDNVCDGSLDASSQESHALTVREFVGPLLIAATFAVLSFVAQIYQCCVYVASRRRESNHDPSHLGKVDFSQTKLAEEEGEADGEDDLEGAGGQMEVDDVKEAAQAASRHNGRVEQMMAAGAEPVMVVDLLRGEVGPVLHRLLDAVQRVEAQARERDATILKLLEREGSQGTDGRGRSASPGSSAAASPRDHAQQQAQAGVAAAGSAEPGRGSPRFVPKLRGRSPKMP